MKKLLLVFVVLLSACTSQHAAAGQTYRAGIKKCDDNASEKLKTPDYSTTIGIKAAISEQIDCYEEIARQIIDKHYAKQSENMKKNMEIYIQASGIAAYGILSPDDCNPNCGTIVGIESISFSLKHAKKYLDMLIDTADMYGYEQ